MNAHTAIRILLIALAQSGCLSSPNFQPPVTGSPAVNEAAVLADVANGPYPSAIGNSTNINVWVTAPDYLSYTRISPEHSGSGATVAVGTLLVREVRDMTGTVQKLTLMMKGPAGYNPDVGDFWFGVTQPDGTPMMDSGTPKLGKLAECFGCHIARAGDGYLFGVPASDRAPIGGGVDGGVAHPDGGLEPDAGTRPDDGGMGCGHGHGHNGGCSN
jgi:hypothetical protein